MVSTKETASERLGESPGLRRPTVGGVGISNKILLPQRLGAALLGARLGKRTGSTWLSRAGGRQEQGPGQEQRPVLTPRSRQT